MTETTPRSQPATEATPPVRPMDILLNLVVTLLTPMFLIDSGGDLTFARMAALETVNSYSARDPMELLTIARIIGFGLAALGSLALSMADDTPPLMMLRWRCNANALNRSAEQNRRALQTSRSACPECASTGHRYPAQPAVAAWGDLPPDAEQARYEAQVLADLAQTQQRVAEAKARQAAANQAAQAVPAAQPIPAAAAPDQATPAAPVAVPAAAPVPAVLPMSAPAPAATPAAAMIAEERYRAVFAAAMTEVAAEFTAELAELSPHQRKEAMVQAAALSSSANELLSGPAMPWPHCAAPPPNPVG